MTDLAVVEEVVLEELILEGDPPHIKCCVLDEFICGAPWHPEASAIEGASLEDVCQRCQEALKDSLCADNGGRHFHCPLKRLRICRRP